MTFRSANVRRFFERLEREGIPWIRERTVPVFALTKKRVPQPNGTGVLLQIADVGFVLSASHVLRRRSTHTLVIFPTDSNQAINLNAMESRVSVDVGAVDIGIVRLPAPAFARVAKDRPFLRLSDLVLTGSPPEEGWYSVCGYPQSLTETDLPARLVTADALYYYNQLRGKPLKNGMEGISIAIEVSTENVDADGEDADLPVPEGVSGCGMWRMHAKCEKPEDWSVASVRLVGIQHSVARDRRERTRAFAGARIHNVIAWIWQEFPDMRTAIDLHMPTLRQHFGPKVREHQRR